MFISERIKVRWEASYLRVEGDASLVRDIIAADQRSIGGSPLEIIEHPWKPPAQPNYPKPEFHPAYLPGNDSVSTAINAMIEIRALWNYVVKDAYYSYSEIYSQLSNPITNTVMDICQKHKEAFAVYDKETKTWLIKSNEPTYKYCYNGNDFEEFEKAKAKISGNRLLLVGKYTTLMQEPNLLRETRTALASNFKLPVTKLIVGVPGCGKTTYIINNHRLRSLVLTSCTEGAEDIRSRMGKIKNCKSSKFRDRYRTIDSYLLHSRRAVDEVWMDEALMEHPGKIFLMCLFSRCKLIYLLGDPNQLGYVNRVNEIELLYDKSSIFFKPALTLNTSYRCPVDVMTVLSSRYDGGTYSTSTVWRSMECKPFTSLQDIAKVNGTKYLVFRQAEKKIMRSAGYNVSTIHEFQGKEAKHVVIVRMSRHLRGWPYDSSPHILVGISRHTESLVYYTSVADGLKKLMMKPLTDEDLQRHRHAQASRALSSKHVTSMYSPCSVSAIATNKQEPSVIKKTISIITSILGWAWNKGDMIDRVDTIRDLGLELDTKLDFHNHIISVVKRKSNGREN